MAFWRKSQIKNYGRNTKTGKMQLKSKTVVTGKGADASKAIIAKGASEKPTKLSNARDLQIQQHNERMAEIANKAATRQAMIGQASLTMQKAIDGFKPMQSNVANTNQVDQLVNGGAQPAGNTRDDDDEDSGWVA